MNIINARIQTRCCRQVAKSSIKQSWRSIHVHVPRLKHPKSVGFRTLTTQRDTTTTSSLLSNALDQKQRSARRDDTVGPFQLGLIPPTPRDDVKVKKWSELSTSGKGMWQVQLELDIGSVLTCVSLSQCYVQLPGRPTWSSFCSALACQLCSSMP